MTNTVAGLESVTSIVPSIGPAQGFTVVKVHGLGFTKSIFLRCLFGSIPVTANWLSDRVVECLAPPFQEGAILEVKISNNGLQPSATLRNYAYHGESKPF
jgi:hypothetical protein